MDAMIQKAKEAIKGKITSIAVTAAAAIMILQNTILPGVFDWMSDAMILGLIYIVGKLHGGLDAKK